MNIITQHFTLIEPGPVQRLGGLTFFPLTVEGKSCPPSLQTFDQLADQGYAGAFEHGADGSVTSVNIENNSPFFLLMLDECAATYALLDFCGIIIPHYRGSWDDSKRRCQDWSRMAFWGRMAGTEMWSKNKIWITLQTAS